MTTADSDDGAKVPSMREAFDELFARIEATRLAIQANDTEASLDSLDEVTEQVHELVELYIASMERLATAADEEDER